MGANCVLATLLVHLSLEEVAMSILESVSVREMCQRLYLPEHFGFSESDPNGTVIGFLGRERRGQV